MGKFRSKLKGQTKGKRWPKGQSSISNPETTRYRDIAKSRFFQENLGPSNLTSDALRKHDAVSSFVPPKIPTLESSEMEEDDESEVSTHKTMDTFASDWSECSNVSFNRLMHIFKSDSALHKEMLAVLAAVTEVIKQNNGTESSTEYYAALMTTLEVTETDMSLSAVLYLLHMGIKSVPVNVLRLQFPQTSKIFIDLLQKNSDSDNSQILKSLLGLLVALLRVQELAVWSSLSTLQILGSVLAFTCHTKPKVRKAAQHGVCALLKASCFMLEDNPPAQHPAASHVANFCVQQLEVALGGSSGGRSTALYTLTLLQDILATFPPKQMKKSCETILKGIALQDAVVTAAGLKALHSLCVIPEALNAQLAGQLISALYDQQPAGTGPGIEAWLAVLAAAYGALSSTAPAAAAAALPRAAVTCTRLWLSERAEALVAATHALLSMLDTTVPNEITAPNIERTSVILTDCLGYQYHRAWSHVLHVLATLFRVTGVSVSCHRTLLDCLRQLAELRDSYNFSYNNELEFAVGVAVKTLGPELVLKVINLKNKDLTINLDRSWLLPILKENIQSSTLEYFAKEILPLATLCQRKSIQLSQTSDGIGTHSYELLYIQLWSLFPSFCKLARDVKDNFKNIAKILGSAISDRKELRLSIMSAIRKLIQNSKETTNEEEKSELGRFAKNFLPILFNLYTTKSQGTDEEGHRLAALDTIREYLTIAPIELTEQLFKNAVNSLQTKTDRNETFVKESILDLIRCLSLYQSNQSLQHLFEECIKNFLDIKNKKEQKKAYRLLEEICNSESEGCKQFVKENRKTIQNLLIKTLNSTAVSSRAARLRCQTYLVRAQPNLHHDSRLFKAIIPEAMLCCKDINEKCRRAAQNLIIAIGETLEKHQEMTQFISLLLIGLAGTPQMVQGTILALAIVTHSFTSALGQQNTTILLKTIEQLMPSPTRDVIAACLVYLKIFINSIPSPIVAQNLSIIVNSITSMTGDCQKHFQLRVRDILSKLIRKFGCDSISALVPASDVIMLKRLRNLRKSQDRKKRQKEATKKQNEDSDEENFIIKAKPRSMEDILADSDSEFEDIDDKKQETKYKRIYKTWIEEDEDDIVDFKDPSAIRKITSTRPGLTSLQTDKSQKSKDRGFKTASDGRLIIQDDSDSNDYKPKKNILTFNSGSDSEDDNKSAAETAILTSSKKRKRTDTESIFSAPAIKYKPGGSGIHRPLAGLPKTSGAEYQSKKAAGDVKKKGKLDPYAYLPLSRKLLNKRKRIKSGGQFRNIVRGAKTGARKGGKRKTGRISKS